MHRVSKILSSQFSPSSSDKSDQKVNKYRSAKEIERRSRKSSELTAIKQVLNSALSRNGLDKRIDRYGFVLRWTEIMGEKLGAITKPECLRQKTLVVRVKNSAWAQELSFIKPEILEKLKPFLQEGDEITDVNFYVGEIK